MSNNDQEQKQVVVIGLDDVKHIRDFFKHFSVGWNSTLEDACVAFEKLQTFENQERLKIEVCKFITNSKNEIFKDKIFGNLGPETDQITYESQFNKDLEEVLSDPKKKN